MTQRLHPVSLHTERLSLRPLVDDDAPALLAIFSHPAVMRYWSTPPWTELAQAHAMIAADRAALAADEALRLGLQRQGEARLVGTVSLFDLRWQSRRAEIGYALAFDAWGQGLMQEALRAFVGHAFETLALNRLEADIDPRNAASARVLERLGFRREGLLRERWIVDGEVSDSALYGLLARDGPPAAA